MLAADSTGLAFIELSSPSAQQIGNVFGEDAWIYWEIDNEGGGQTVGELHSLT